MKMLILKKRNSKEISIYTFEKISFSSFVQSPRVRICTLKNGSPGADVMEKGCLSPIVPTESYNIEFTIIINQ
jgi:hypothetical protein